jgi:hypothetical protein
MGIYSNLFVLSLLGLSATQAISINSAKSEVRRNKFGAMELIDYTETGSHKTVMLPLKNFAEDYIQ